MAFAEEDLSMKKIEQRTGYGAGVKPSYDYDLHNQLLSNESDTIV